MFRSDQDPLSFNGSGSYLAEIADNVHNNLSDNDNNDLNANVNDGISKNKTVSLIMMILIKI